MNKLSPRILLLAVACALTACAGKETAVPVSPLPEIAATNAVTLARLWSVDSGSGAQADGLRLQPSPTAQTVFVADQNGRLAARDRANGAERWKTKSAQAFSAGPVAAYGQLFVGTREGELLAYAAETGAPAWKVQLGGEILTPPAVDSDAVLVKSTDGRVTLVDRVSGTVRWAHDGGSPSLALRTASKPVLLADAAVVGLASGMLVALDRSNGQLIWERRVSEPEGKSELERLVDIAGDFIVDGERLYAANYQGRLVALDMRSGQFVWQQPLSSLQSLAVAAGAVFSVDAESRVAAWRSDDGVVLWRQDGLRGRGLTGCAVYGNYLLSGDDAGYLHVMRQSDGVIVARKRIDRDGIAVVPVVDEGVVFVLGRGGKLAALKIE